LILRTTGIPFRGNPVHKYNKQKLCHSIRAIDEEPAVSGFLRFISSRTIVFENVRNSQQYFDCHPQRYFGLPSSAIRVGEKGRSYAENLRAVPLKLLSVMRMERKQAPGAMGAAV